MEELLYLLKVGKDAQAEVKKRLRMDTAPTVVRVATMAPLSNYGFPPGSEGALLGLDAGGLVVGVEGNQEAPHLFVPWQNVSYVADGDRLYKEKAEAAKAAAEG